MEDGNKITDKVIRRVSSRSRRIALRARRETGSSSSESELDTQSPKVLRKIGSSDHSKPSAFGSSGNSTNISINNSNNSSNNNNALQKKRALTNTRTVRLKQRQQSIKPLSSCSKGDARRKSADNHDTATTQQENTTNDHCQTLLPSNALVRYSKQEDAAGSLPLESQSKLLPLSPSAAAAATTTTTQLLSSSGQQKLNNYVDDPNTGESEDADYVSDDHSYSRPSKSNVELDVSMDESLAESSGRESGYLSSIDLSFLNRSGTSSISPPTISPHSAATAFSQHNSSLGYSSCISNASKDKSKLSCLHLLKPEADIEADVDEDDDDADDENSNVILKRKNVAGIQITTKIPSSTSTSSLGSAILSPQQSLSFLLSCSKATKKFVDVDSDVAVPDYVTTTNLLKQSVIETKYVTAIFEMTVGGIDELIADVNNELKTWFNSELGLMGIACEIQWSVPEKYRNRTLEMRMKSALHASLRENNLRVLNMKNNFGVYMPLTLAAAVTQENCGRDQKLNSFQGIYRRFYESLLPYQHKETGKYHASYWKLDTDTLRNLPTPKPQQFIFGSNPTELDRGSLIALNVIALKVANNK
uniref:Uncharacterized protein n=1 Tax=Syphacia muris TaxID=451379 RepID=A0A0N5AJL6_9BILA